MNVGEYKILYELGSDVVFKWYEAVEQYGDNKKVILQVLQSGFSSQAIDAIFDYLESLQTLRRKSIWTPIQMFSSAEYPLVAIYPHLNGTDLTQILPKEPKDALSFWQQLSENLHILNNKGLVYGYLCIHC